MTATYSLDQPTTTYYFNTFFISKRLPTDSLVRLTNSQQVIMQYIELNGVSTSTQKRPPHSCQVPPKSANYLRPPFQAISPSILVFCEPAPLKVRLFSEPPKYQSFPPLTTSYLLKVTEFFVKISQFECLVIMTEKYFCLQNIFIFLCENCTPSPPEKKSSPSFQAIPL